MMFGMSCDAERIKLHWAVQGLLIYMRGYAPESAVCKENNYLVLRLLSLERAPKSHITDSTS